MKKIFKNILYYANIPLIFLNFMENIRLLSNLNVRVCRKDKTAGNVVDDG
jgi:hypothetical protein